MSGYFEVVGEDEGSGEGFGDEVFCSVIFLFILIYYNNEISPWYCIHTQKIIYFLSMVICFFRKMRMAFRNEKHPPFGGCVK